MAATAFPVLKDLVVTAPRWTGSSPPAARLRAHRFGAGGRAIPVPKPNADRAFTAAACIGCGACVAACPNGSASLFLGAKIAHLAELPQGQPERYERVVNMVDQHDAEGFGGCTNIGQCTGRLPEESSRRDRHAEPRLPAATTGGRRRHIA